MKSLRGYVATLGRERASGDSGPLATAVMDLEESSRSLFERWHHLDADSPFGDVADEVTDLLAAAATSFDRDQIPAGLGRGLALWARARGSRAVAKSLRAARSHLGDISLRDAARRSGIAPGHLSELEDGRGSLPTTSTARRLDAGLGTDLVGLLTNFREALPPAVRSRQRRRAVGTGSLAPPAALDPRLDALFSRIAGDDRLVQVNEDLLRLSATARRSIAQMIRTLAADLSQKPGIGSPPRDRA